MIGIAGFDWSAVGGAATVLLAIVQFLRWFIPLVRNRLREHHEAKALNGGITKGAATSAVRELGMRVKPVRRVHRSEKLSRPEDVLLEPTADRRGVVVTVARGSIGPYVHVVRGLLTDPRFTDYAIVTSVLDSADAKDALSEIGSDVRSPLIIEYFNGMLEHPEFRKLVGDMQAYELAQPRSARWDARRVAERQFDTLRDLYRPFVEAALRESLRSDNEVVVQLARGIVDVQTRIMALRAAMEAGA